MAKRTFASRTLGKARTFAPATLAGVAAEVTVTVVRMVAGKVFKWGTRSGKVFKWGSEAGKVSSNE